MKKWARSVDDSQAVTSIQLPGPDSARNSRAKSFPAIVKPLRHLTMISGSVLMDRFDRVVSKLGMSTLVGDMQKFRNLNLTAHHFIDIVKRPGDPPTNTGVEKLKFLSYGSPTLRYILSQIRDYVLPTEADGTYEKLLITEDLPNLAWFWEKVLQFLYIDAVVLHANLGNNERQMLQDRFNDPNDSLKVKIVMYSVSSQGVNLDKACNRVLIATGAINAPLELQAAHRVIRVSILLCFNRA